MHLKSTLKFIRTGVLTFAVILLFQSQSFGQWTFGMEVSPRQSAYKSLGHKIGYTNIDIKYGSPTVKGRKIWGELVPYKEVWRAGANNATTMVFSKAVEINEQPLGAGTYSFYILPVKNGQWELIFNKTHDQWGAFNYDEAEDALRIFALPIQSYYSENLVYTVENTGPDYGMVYLNWGHYKIGFQVDTNHLQFIEETMVSSYGKADEILKWVCYLEGADYLLKLNTKPDLALKWINQSEKEVLALKKGWNSKYTSKEFMMGSMYWVKARLLAKKGDFKMALKNAEKMKALEGEFLYYPMFKKQMNIDEKIVAWEKKGKQ